MAVIFMDSCGDHYATSDIPLKWDANTGFSVSASGGRCNTAGLSYDGSGASGIKKNVPSAATYIVGFAYLLPAVGGLDTIIAAFYENTTKHVDIIVQADGRIAARRAGSVILGTSTNFLTAGAYNYIEIKATISDTVGVIVVRVGATATGWLNLSSQDTQNGGTSNITNIRLGGDLISANLGMRSNWDDIVILDTTGAVNNDFLGDCRVEAIIPNGAGNYSQWTPSAGSNFQNVDETPPNSDTDYNSSSTAGQIDTFAYSNLSITSGTVKAVGVNVFARKDDAGTRTVAGASRLSATDIFSAGQLIGNTYADYQNIFETKPGGGAWTITDVNNSEFGYKLIS